MVNILYFEGLDASGKSTQINMLKTLLTNNNIPCVSIDSLAGEDHSKLGRELLSKTTLDNPTLHKQLLHNFFLSVFYKKIADIREYVAENNYKYILVDRWSLSMEAYNNIKYEDLVFTPDSIEANHILIWIDSNIEDNIARLKDRPNKEIFEEKQELERVYNNYISIIKDIKENIPNGMYKGFNNIIEVPNDLSIESSFKYILDKLDNL